MNARSIILAILFAAAAAAATAAPALAADEAPSPAPAGSLTRQLRLLAKLNAAKQGVALADALDHNRQAWQRLAPDQRERFRQIVLAWRNRSPEQQAQLLRRVDEWISTADQQREKYRRMNRWLGDVVASFSPAEREALREMSPEQRARKIIQRRDELVAKGELVIEPPSPSPAEPDANSAERQTPATTPAPASAPTTQPA